MFQGLHLHARGGEFGEKASMSGFQIVSYPISYDPQKLDFIYIHSHQSHWVMFMVGFLLLTHAAFYDLSISVHSTHANACSV